MLRQTTNIYISCTFRSFLSISKDFTEICWAIFEIMAILIFGIFATFLSLSSAEGEVQIPCLGLHQHFVNDYAGCTRYFSCVNGVPHPIECPDGRWFSSDPLGCAYPDTVPCERCPSEGIFSFGVAQSCIDYTLCINGVAFERQCVPGTRFDWRQGRCDLKELVQCDYLRCPETGTQIVADPTSCRHYLICVDGEEVGRRECSEHLLFDPALGSCSRSENVICPLA